MRIDVAIVALSSLFLLASSALADVVELKTGQRVEGTLKQATPASVTVEVGGQAITFEGEKVRAIYFGTAPALVATQPSARDEAMKALRGLRSVVQGGGITYRDYAPRVSDAKIVVDRYLADASDSPERGAIRESMDYYSYAASAWNSSISRSGYDAVGASPLIAKCAALTAEIDRTKRDQPYLFRGGSPSLQVSTIGIVVGTGGVPAIWSCAADKLAEAEKLIGATK